MGDKIVVINLPQSSKLIIFLVTITTKSAAINKIFDFIYAEGGDVEGADGWHRLTTQFGLANGDAQIAAPEIKQTLKNNTDEALAAGVFGVPTFVADGVIFWGQDGTGMFLDWLKDPAGFATGEFARIADLPYGAQRSRR